MTRVDPESAKLALMELAEVFGASDDALLDHIVPGMTEIQPPGLLPVAIEGRLFLRGDKVVYVLAKPVPMLTGEALTEIVMREPVAADYVQYSKGMSVTVKDGATEIDAVMMTRRTMRTVSKLADQAEGIIDKLAVRDIRTLGEVCDALGFFE